MQITYISENNVTITSEMIDVEVAFALPDQQKIVTLQNSDGPGLSGESHWQCQTSHPWLPISTSNFPTRSVRPVLVIAPPVQPIK